jgi:hypothetical protein
MSSCFLTGDLELPFATYNPELLATLNPQLDREIVRQKAQQTTSFRPKCMLNAYSVASILTFTKRQRS